MEFLELKTRASQGDQGAQYLLGQWYERGEGGLEPDSQAARYWYDKAAHAGHAGALMHLGQAYLEGKGVRRDEKQGLHYLERATRLSGPSTQEAAAEAHRFLADYYESQGQPKQAFEHLKGAWGKGDGSVATRLAESYLAGHSGGSEPERAFELLRGAARDGRDPEVMFKLGLLHQQGIGTPVNLNEAAHWLGKAAARGQQAALLALQLLARQGGHAIAERRLGEILQESGDTAQAQGWIRQAAVQGDPLAQLRASVWEGGEQSATWRTQGLTGTRELAEQGDLDAQLTLARWYTEEEPDRQQSLRWSELAAEQGDIAAMRLSALTLAEDDHADSQARAQRWFMRAAEQGDTLSQLNIARMYERGEHDQADLSQALHWYRLAAAAGNQEAEEAVTRLTQENQA